MTAQKIYLISHHELEPVWKLRGTSMTPSKSVADYYKIGVGKEPEKRVSQCQTGTPHELELTTTITSDKPEKAEQRLHSIYKFSHQRGEWYKLTSNAVNSLVALDHIDYSVLSDVAKYSNEWLVDESLYVAYKNRVENDE